MAYEYAWNQFLTAVFTLAESQDKLPGRVYTAFARGLIHLREEDLPEELRERFRALQVQVNRAAGKDGRGILAEPGQLMTATEARKIIHEIVRLHTELTRLMGKNPGPEP